MENGFINVGPEASAADKRKQVTSLQECHVGERYPAEALPAPFFKNHSSTGRSKNHQARSLGTRSRMLVHEDCKVWCQT